MKMLRRNPPATETAPPPASGQAAQVVTRRRVEVTVEREWARETISPNQQAAQQPVSFEAHCPSCDARVLMIPPSAAARIAGVTIRIIYRWVDEKRLHFIESPAGDLYLCAQSIPAPSPTQAIPNKTLPPGDSR